MSADMLDLLDLHNFFKSEKQSLTKLSSLKYGDISFSPFCTI